MQSNCKFICVDNVYHVIMDNVLEKHESIFKCWVTEQNNSQEGSLAHLRTASWSNQPFDYLMLICSVPEGSVLRWRINSAVLFSECHPQVGWRGTCNYGCIKISGSPATRRGQGGRWENRHSKHESKDISSTLQLLMWICGGDTL